MNTDFRTETFEVPLYLLSVVYEKTDKMNRRAQKIGVLPVSLNVSAPYERASDTYLRGTYRNADNKLVRKCVSIEVVGVAPTIEGFTLVATVDGRGETNILRRVPGAPKDVDLSEFFTTDMGRCDHCHTNRHRNDVLILREDATGAVIQVGRNCAADFFRNEEDIVRLIKGYDHLLSISDDDFEDRWENTPRGEHYLGLEEVLTMVAAVTRVEGFVSAAVARDTDKTATKVHVYTQLLTRHTMKPEWRIDPTDEDRDYAKEIFSWIKADFLDKPVEDRSEFERNICGVLEFEATAIRERNLGYVAWMASGLKRKKDADAKKAADATKFEGSEWIGDVGERLTVMAELITKRFYDNSFGGSHMCRFRDMAGNSIIWWATNSPEISEGETYTLTGTVKKLDSFNGTKQTVLTRVRTAT